MTTAAELGLKTPQGSDFISLGDNAITDNANKVAEIYDELNIMPITPLATGDNLSLIRGWRRCTNTSVASSLGLPAAPGVFGGFEILSGGTARVETYLVMRGAGADADLYIRHRNASVYSRWKNVSNNELQTLTSSSDLNALPTGGYLISNRIVATDLGMPVAAPGYLQHTKLGNGWMETFTTIDNDPVESFTYQRAKSLNGIIQDWRRMANAGETGGSGDTSGSVRRELLQQDLTARKGGTIGTGGKGVIALRFDDAPVEFRTTILPLLEERNLPFTRVSTSESINGTAIDPAEFGLMQTYCIQSGGEVWNHGTNHLDATSETAIYNNVIGSLDALRTAMPRIPIDCFAPPGGAETFYDGWTMKTLETWASTYAGRLLTGHHAIVSGYFQDTYYRPLDGQLRDGQIHYSCDAYTSGSTVNTLVNRARDWKVGVSLMWHSNNIGATGKQPLAEFISVLDYIVAQRDAGNIEVLTLSGLATADVSSTYRDDVLIAHAGSTFSETVLYPQYRQSVLGSTRELTATVTGTAGTTVTSVIGESSKTHTIPAGGTLKLRHVATIPADATTLTVSIDAQTANAHLYAV